MAGNPLQGVARLRAAFVNSCRGFKVAWVHEQAFRQEVILLVIAIPLSFFVAESMVEQLLLVAVVLFLMLVELLNSAIESAVDRVGLECHELSGRAKDQASAAVLLAAVLAAGTWLVVALT